MEKLGARLGKLSLKILEHFVGTTLGEGFVDELRKPTDRELAIESALENSEKRFASEFSDQAFAAKMFSQVSDQNLGLLSDTIEKFYDHPTDPDFQSVLSQIIAGSFPEIDASHVVSAVDLYINILTEEFALADEKFRENVRGLSDLRMVNILRRVEAILAKYSPGQIIHDTIGFIPPANTETYVYRGKIEEDVRNALRAGSAIAIVGVNAPGGTGKTELANRIAQEVREGKFPVDNILWVDVGEKAAREIVDDMLLKSGIQTQPAMTFEDKRMN